MMNGNGNGNGSANGSGRRFGETIDRSDPASLTSAEGWANRSQIDRSSDRQLDDDHGEETCDDVNRPKHYRQHPSGVECIEIVEHMTFNVGSAIKYLWRAGLKTIDPIEDLRKAEWFCRREIARLSIEQAAATSDPG